MVASLQQRLRVRRGALLAPEEMAAADAGRRLAHGRLGLVGRLVGHLLRLVGHLLLDGLQSARRPAPPRGAATLYELAQRRHQPLARAIVDLLRLEGTAQRVREVGGACAAGGQMTRARHVS